MKSFSNFSYYFSRLIYLCLLIFYTPFISYGSSDLDLNGNKKIIAQSISVHGKVTDESGEPLAFVNVTVKGDDTKGTNTDEDGNYELDNVKENDVLVFTFIGYEDKSIKVQGQKEINTEMSPTTESLDELVLTGYRKQRKGELTGAVSDLSSDEAFKNKPTADPTDALQGRVAGLYISQTTGDPSKKFNPVIRGKGSIGAGGRALVLIDGVEGDLSRVNPNDIEDISVIKDASAAAKYGSRAAFGVILVETKDADEDKFKVDYSFSYSLKDRTVKPDLVTDGYLWAENFNKGYKNWNGDNPTSINTGLSFSQEYKEELKKHSYYPSLPKVDVDPSSGKYIYYGSSDWQDLLFKDPNSAYSHNLRISGNSEKLSYVVSGRFEKEEGIFEKSSDTYRNYNLRAKASLQVFPWLEFKNNFSYNHRGKWWTRSQHNSGATITRRIGDEFSPLAQLRNPDGTFTKNAAITMESYFLENKHNGHKRNWDEFKNIFQLEAKFFDDELTIHADGNYRFIPYLKKEQRYPVPYSEKPGEIKMNEPDNDWAAETTHRSTHIGANLFGEFEHDFDKHNIDVMVGYNYETTDRTDRHYKRYQMVNPDLPNPDLLTGEDIDLTGGGYQWTTNGIFFTGNYNYDQRYLLELNGRYDGSSRFPSGDQFGFFPSASIGWVPTEESFWPSSTDNIISNLKLRASLGQLGNGKVGQYKFLQTMSVDKSPRIINGNRPLQTHRPNVIPEGLTWEKVTTRNLGIDLSMFENRLNINFDKYLRKTTDMYTAGVPLPGVFGTSAPKGNFADMKNRGWELAVSWDDRIETTDPISYGVRFTLSDTKSKVTKFNNPDGLIDSYYKGQTLGEIWGFETDGLYQNEEEIIEANIDQTKFPATVHDRNTKPGDLKFVDQNGDGKIDDGARTLDDHGDLKRIGNNQPRYEFGFRGNISWKNWSFDFFFQGVGKRDWWPSSDAVLFWGQLDRPYTMQPKEVLAQQWTKDNPDAYFPREVGYASNGTGQNKMLNVPSSRYLQNAAYIRFKTVTLTYELPHSLVKKVGLSDASVFFSGENLWVWSPMFKHITTMDPEGTLGESKSNDFISPVIGGSYGLAYPKQRRFTLGINLTF